MPLTLLPSIFPLLLNDVLTSRVGLMLRAVATILAFGSLVASSSLSAGWPTSQKHQSRAEAEKIDFHVVGEISGNKTYEQDIGHDLAFALVPPQGGENAGWVVEIVPKNQPEDGPVEFSGVATPPFHAYSERYIATVYGRLAADVINLKDRTFFFVESIDDEHRAEEVVNATLYPTNLSDEDRVRIVQERQQIPLGKGELRILKARVGHKLNDVGTIDYLRFEVNVELSSGLTMADIVARVAHPQ